MTKYIKLLSLASAFVLTSCGNVELIPQGDWPWDDAGHLIGIDAGMICNPADMVSLQTDFSNCGSCGTQCDVNDADSCVNGYCRCGFGPPCTEGSDCIAGRCLRSDRFTECTEDGDCPNESGAQQCLFDGLSDTGICLDSCEFNEECPGGFACVEGACTRRDCVHEECDGVDNDCDGVVDENSDGTGPLSQWCLTGGDPTVAPLPPCQRGTQVCSAGAWSECRDEIPPLPETGLLSCNRRDDDCDGCVDGRYDETGTCVVTPPNGFDVLYLIDISGSMFDQINAVKTATASFSALYAGNPEFRFALVIIAGSAQLDRRAVVRLDFSDFATFNSVMSTITANGGGFEATWDAVYESVTGEIAYGVDADGDGYIDSINEDRRGLSWREGSIRIMALFGDEEGQTYREFRELGRVNETVMCRSLTHGEFFVVFGTSLNETDFDDCATHYELSTDPNVMINHLRDIVRDPCL